MMVGMKSVHLALGLTQDGESGIMCGSSVCGGVVMSVALTCRRVLVSMS